MNDTKAYANSYNASARKSATSTLAEASIALSGRAYYEKSAIANGLTVEVMAAAAYVQSISQHLSEEAKVVLADKDKAIPALERVAGIPSCDYLEMRNRINAAILGA